MLTVKKKIVAVTAADVIKFVTKAFLSYRGILRLDHYILLSIKEKKRTFYFNETIWKISRCKAITVYSGI